MALLPGNLLPESMQSMTSVTGWTVTGANASIDAAATISPDPQGAMLCASTSITPLVISTTSTYPCTEGAEVVGGAWFMGTARAGDVVAALEWLDDDSNPVGSPTTATQSDGVSITTPDRVSVYGPVPEGATQVRLRFTLPVVNSSEATYVDGAYLGQPQAGNLLDYGDYSAEHELPPWESSRDTDPVRERHPISVIDGTWAVGIPAELGLTTMVLDRAVPVTPGQTYSAAVNIVCESENPAVHALAARPGLRFYDSDGELLPMDHAAPFYESVTDTPTHYLSSTVRSTPTAPSGAATARLAVDVRHEAGSGTERFLFDQAAVYPSLPNYTLSVYDDLGYIELFVPQENTMAGDVTVERVDENGARSYLRTYGSETYRVPWSSPSDLSIEDYEAPVGSRVHYLVTWREVGSPDSEFVRRTTTRSVTAPQIADTSHVWLKHPGQPAYNLRALVVSALAWDRAAVHAAHRVVGRATPIVISAARASRTGSIQILTETIAQRDLLDDTLGMGQPMLLQAAPGHGISGNLYLAVGDVSYAPDGDDGMADAYVWDLAVTEIDRPEGGLQGSAGRTWATIADEFDSWDDVDRAFNTWADVATGNEG